LKTFWSYRNFSTYFSFWQELSSFFLKKPGFFGKIYGQSLNVCPFSYSENEKGGVSMPKNNKSAPVRTLLFVLLTCVLLCCGSAIRTPTVKNVGLSGILKEVISWMGQAP
jgi:hypothetical protein